MPFPFSRPKVSDFFERSRLTVVRPSLQSPLFVCRVHPLVTLAASKFCTLGSGATLVPSTGALVPLTWFAVPLVTELER